MRSSRAPRSSCDVRAIPTALGWKALAFFALLSIAYFAAPYQNLFFLLLAFMGSLGGLNALWTWRNVAGVSAEFAPVDAVAAGTPAGFSVTIDAGRRRRLDLTILIGVGKNRTGTAHTGLV